VQSPGGDQLHALLFHRATGAGVVAATVSFAGDFVRLNGRMPQRRGVADK